MKCKPGCQCGRHKREISDEHRANIVKANQARKGESHKCPEGCTCARHQAYYRGGSKKGRTFSAEAREHFAEGARNRQRSPEELQRLADQMRANHDDPEWEAKRIAALKEAGTACPPECECERHSEEVRRQKAEDHLGTVHSEETKAKIGAGAKAAWARKTPEERSEIAWLRIKKYGVAKVSQQEYALAPYLAALGYKHNDDRALCVGRKFPDFYDEENRRLFEYFGNYWHPRPEEEAEVIDYYQLLGWECVVLWEADLLDWMRDHSHLVTAEAYEGTREMAEPLD